MSVALYNKTATFAQFKCDLCECKSDNDYVNGTTPTNWIRVKIKYVIPPWDGDPRLCATKMGTKVLDICDNCIKILDATIKEKGQLSLTRYGK